MPSFIHKSFSHKKLSVNNRLVMAPMTQESSPGNVPGHRQVRHYASRAEGGIGLIITEGTCIEHAAANGHVNVPYIYGEKALKGWKQVVEAVHLAGSKIIPQLWHVGGVRRSHMEPIPGVEAVSPSGLSAPLSPNGRAMTPRDVEDVISAYASAAINAKNTGFDGIEVHGAHGYLIDQFLWQKTNLRNDEYGGTLENRVRFAAQVVRAIREATGPEFSICFRWSQWKIQDFSAQLFTSPTELESFLGILVDAGVDIFHCSTRQFWLPGFSGAETTLAGWTKKLSGKPTIAVGGIGLGNDFLTGAGSLESDLSLKKLEEVFARDEFDLAAVGRALLNNPEWAKTLEKKPSLV